MNREITLVANPDNFLVEPEGEQHFSSRWQERNDAHAASIGNAFDFAMKPRKFKTIPSKYPQAFFLHQPLSGDPPDTQ